MQRGLFLGLLFFGLCALAQEAATPVATPSITLKDDTITVRATGTASVKADRAYVDFSISGKAEEAVDASKKFQSVERAVSEALSLPTYDISSVDSADAVSPISSILLLRGPFSVLKLNQNNTDLFLFVRSYRVLIRNLKKLSDVKLQEKLSAISTAILDAGAESEYCTNRFAIRFELNDTAELLSLASKDGVNRARERAHALATASGRKLGKVLLISDENPVSLPFTAYGITKLSSSETLVSYTMELIVVFKLE